MSEILTSESGKKMFSYVSPIYDQSKVMQAIFECIGKEVDDLHAWCSDILNQFFPQTATWALDIWENRLGIITNTLLPIEIRRRNVLRKLTTRTPVTPSRMKSIIEAVSGVEVDIEQNIAPYTFRILLISQGSENIDVWQVNQTIKNTKPAHLSFEMLMETRAVITIGISIEHFKLRYNMAGTGNAGTIPDINIVGTVPSGVINYDTDAQSYKLSYPMCGIKKAGQ